MNTLNTLCLFTALIVLLPARQVFAQSDFSIATFATGTRSIPPAGNQIIVPFEGSTLKQVSNVPDLKSGEVLLRRRFSAGQYGLYIGKINEQAYTKLSAFRIPENISLTTMVSRKVYGQEVTNPDLDLGNVYFEKGIMYVENAARLFYRDGLWKCISMESRLPARLTVISDPAGAQVLIDGKVTGVTPYYAGVVFVPSAVVQVRMEGYYILEEYVDLEGKASVTKKFALSKKLSFSDGGQIDAEAYSAENTESVEELELRIAELEQKAAAQKRANDKALRDFEAKFPALPPKDEFELTEEFKARKKKWLGRKNAERGVIEKAGGEKLALIRQTMEKVRQYKTVIESRVYQRYFPMDRLTLGTYVADSGYFPVTVAVREGDFDFTYKGTLTIPRAVAREFKSRVGEGRLALSYRNKTIAVSAGGERVRRYFDFTAFMLRFRETEYALKGDFVLPGYLTGSSAWKEKDEGMVWIPGGTFMMGKEDGENNEKPVRQVMVSGFYMSNTEVTQTEYEKVMGKNPSRFRNCPDCPVENVSWNDAVEFCKRIGGRLPTEAEWEYACRAGSTTEYYWGDRMDGSYAWYYGNSGDKTHPVGQKKPNAFGLYDMTGNVWEWCSDWYGDYSSSSQKNPKGAASGSYRVLRGGSWVSLENRLRSAIRYNNYPVNRNDLYGFRCVASR